MTFSLYLNEEGIYNEDFTFSNTKEDFYDEIFTLFLIPFGYV